MKFCFASEWYPKRKGKQEKSWPMDAEAQTPPNPDSYETPPLLNAVSDSSGQLITCKESDSFAIPRT